MCLCSAVSSPLDRSKRFTLHPWQTCSSWHQLDFSAMLQLTAQRLFTHIPTTDYIQVLIYTAEWTEASWREGKCPGFEKAAKGCLDRVQHTIAEVPCSCGAIEATLDTSLYIWVRKNGLCLGTREDTGGREKTGNCPAKQEGNWVELVW